MTDFNSFQPMLELVKFDNQGLCPVVAQDALTGEVRMVAYASLEALQHTLTTGIAHFYSRSRNSLWKKGESSGNTLTVKRLLIDCDGDCVLYQVIPTGPTCHTGAVSCFFREAAHDDWREVEAPFTAADELFSSLIDRRDHPEKHQRSYTRTLLDGGSVAIGAKLREEADELARAIANEPSDRVASEAADVMYHLMVALVSRGVSWRDVLAMLAKRQGRSGLDEKAARVR
jgi:phosphoribosyl-AMP cyclohydrolase / phosphoribosyl-ATP pyrophosphohydrolase